MIIAAQVAKMLYGSGIRRVYGLPGEDHMALLDAFHAAGLTYVAAFDESSAVLMAAAEAQLSGQPGVAMLSLAPGVSNGINGLLNTYLDEIPLLLISGQHPAGQLPFVVRQGFNIEQLVTPITRWRARITADMDIPQVVGKALDEATGPRPGPVYLELPDDVATATSRTDDAGVDGALARVGARMAKPAIAPDRRVIDAVAARLASARRPVLVIGGRRRRLTPATTAAFASAYRIPVFTTTKQKGLVHSGCSYFAGTFLNGRLEKDLVDQADLVLLVDPEAFDFYNKPWNFAAPAVALVDTGFNEWGRPLAEVHVADAEATLLALTERAGVASQWTEDDVRRYRAGLRATLLPESDAFSVAAAVDGALAGWPTDGYLVADAGFSKPLVAMLSEPSVPDRFFSSNALSTMGYTIPTTGALRQHGVGPILSFLGDGSLLMRGTGLMVSTGAGPGTVYVALMDQALTQIEVKQERRELATVGVTLPKLSCAKLGDAFGIEGVDVSSPEELTAAVHKGLRGDRPVLVGAHVDPAPSRVLFDVLRG